MRGQPANNRERMLSDVIDQLLHHVEELGCTCADNDQYNSRHTQSNRRRKDSDCTGVGLAVAADQKRRRALSMPVKEDV